MMYTKKNHTLTVLIMIGLFILIIISILAGIFLRELSFSVAVSNPELQHMRIPVLIIGMILIGIFIANLILAEFLLRKISQDTVFTRSSVILLKSMSWLFISETVPLALLYIITESNVKSSITQLYVILFCIIYLTAGLIFRLLANLISDASKFKQEVDMTV